MLPLLTLRLLFTLMQQVNKILMSINIILLYLGTYLMSHAQYVLLLFIYPSKN